MTVSTALCSLRMRGHDSVATHMPCDRSPERKGQTAHSWPTDLQDLVSFANCSATRPKLSSIGFDSLSHDMVIQREISVIAASGLSYRSIIELYSHRQQRLHTPCTSSTRCVTTDFNRQQPFQNVDRHREPTCSDNVKLRCKFSPIGGSGTTPRAVSAQVRQALPHTTSHIPPRKPST